MSTITPITPPQHPAEDPFLTPPRNTKQCLQDSSPITPPAKSPAPYHNISTIQQIVESKISKSDRQPKTLCQLRKALKRRKEDMPLSIMPAGSSPVIEKARSLLPQIAKLRKDSLADTISPIKLFGKDTSIRVHLSDPKMRDQRAFTLTTPTDELTLGQHVQTDANKKKHNSLFPIKGKVKGKKILQSKSIELLTVMKSHKTGDDLYNALERNKKKS